MFIEITHVLDVSLTDQFTKGKPYNFVNSELIPLSTTKRKEFLTPIKIVWLKDDELILLESKLKAVAELRRKFQEIEAKFIELNF